MPERRAGVDDDGWVPDGWVEPVDAADPRFAGADEMPVPPRPRVLVESRGPGASEMDPAVRVLRVAIPAVFVLALVAITAVFAIGLDPGDPSVVLGAGQVVEAVAAERPRRVCHPDGQPCAWLTVVEGELLALSADGPLGEESGRSGVGWCPASGFYGSDVSGSRFDPRGHVVRGPAPRSLDRYRLQRDAAGTVTLDFAALTTGRQVGQVGETLPPTGPDCPTIPFDRALELPVRAPIPARPAPRAAPGTGAG